MAWTLSFCLVTLSCIREEASVHDGGKTSVTFQFDAGACRSKSALFGDDGRISDLNLYLYRQGRLEWHLFRGTSADIVLDLLDGQEYDVFCLANVGRHEAPDDEDEMKKLALDFSSPEEVAAGGVPMASQTPLSFVVSGSGSRVEVNMDRLVARYDFQLDISHLSEGSFEVQSVRLKQAPTHVAAFADISKVSDVSYVCDGDYASSEDLSKLNHGQAVSFYVMENMQGVLLPDNDDPWAKEFFNPSVGQGRDLCTYLEVAGKYKDKSGGLEAKHTYRMYLGADAVTDFNIARNTEYCLTLSLSDLGAYRESWKVERTDVEDSRWLGFDPDVVEILPYRTAELAVLAQPASLEWTLDWDDSEFDASCLSAPMVSDGKVKVCSFSKPLGDREVLLYARTFDGCRTAVCTLLVKSRVLPDFEAAWSGPRPTYVAQSGIIRCFNYDESCELEASSADEGIARVVRVGDDWRVEALKEGSTTITVSRSDGGQVQTVTLPVEVAPVHLQTAGYAYLAFTDGGSNAVRNDQGAAPEEWRLYYELPKEAFDESLYEELLKPSYSVVRNGSGESVDYFYVDEEELVVRRWGGALADVAGSYRLTASPAANIYAGGQQYISRTVTVNPVVLVSSSMFVGENGYYMPDPGRCAVLEGGGNACVSVGNPDNLKICVTDRMNGFGRMEYYIECPYEIGPSSSGYELNLHLRPSYDEILRVFPSGCYNLRGRGFKVLAVVNNPNSGETSEIVLGDAEIFLTLAATSKLARWPSARECDTDGDYFLIPCLYSERLDGSILTFTKETEGRNGTLPLYLNPLMVTGMPVSLNLYGSRIPLSETCPTRYKSQLPEYQLNDISAEDACLNLTKVAYYGWGYGEELFDNEAYLSLEGESGNYVGWKHGWRLYDPVHRTSVPDGGHVDYRTVDDSDYYLRIYDYAETLTAEFLEE